MARKFLLWFLREDLKEEVDGDLYEKYQSKVINDSTFQANLHYWYQVIHYLRPFAIRMFSLLPKLNSMMWRQNIRISLRTLRNNFGFTILNVGGLALGIMVFILIGLWLRDELSYDDYHKNKKRVAQIMQNQMFADGIRTWNSMPWQVGQAIRSEYDHIFEHVITSTNSVERLFVWNDDKSRMSGRFMEPGAIQMLSLKMLQGASDLLTDPTVIFLSESAAIRLFGRNDPMDELIRIDDQMDARVVGIYEDIPENSSFSDLNYVAPWQMVNGSANFESRAGWGNNWFQAFVQLKEGIDFEDASALIKDVKKDNVAEDMAERYNPQLFLHPMEKWHLFSDFENGMNRGGAIQYVWLFSIIGVFVLILACINFINLSTARSQKRAREIGVRKTIGSTRGQLISQFLTESLLISLFSYAVGLVLAFLLMPFFNEISQKSIVIPYEQFWFWVTSFGFILSIGIFSGLYPALYLSSFKPIRVLKGLFSRSQGALQLRRFLVSTQFVVSIALIIGTIIIVQQIQFAKTRPIGYNQNNIVAIPIEEEKMINDFERLKLTLMESGHFEAIAATDVYLTSTYTTNSGFYWEGKDPGMSEEFNTVRTTHGFGDLFQWEIVHGRDFSRDHTRDTLAFILNETAVTYMGLDDPVGKRITWGQGEHARTFEVIGVAKDMITTSPYEPSRPMVFSVHYGGFLNYFNARIKPEHSAEEALLTLQTLWEQEDPVNPFRYTFLDERYSWKFQNEERLSKLSSGFAILAIIISCLGLLGISAFVAEQRKKEMGVRKVLGATTFNIWYLLSREFFLLVLIASAIATPIILYYMQSWLTNFEYRIEVTWWMVLLGVGITIMITLLTISYNGLRSALESPIFSIRTDD